MFLRLFFAGCGCRAGVVTVGPSTTQHVRVRGSYIVRGVRRPGYVCRGLLTV